MRELLATSRQPRRPLTAPSALAPLRTRVKRAILRTIDRGWFGFIPLHTHLVICGFPRSGTTLLQLMAETAYPHARTFGKERPALGAAHNLWPGRHALMISKRPDDVFWIDEIRECYRQRGTSTRVRFIVTTRDPRAVLTSVHSMNRENYWVSIERWREIYECFRRVRHMDDVLVVEYRDLVLDPMTIERRLADAVGIKPARGFTEFHRTVPAQFDTSALNGVRPLDPATIDRWRSPRHRQRIQQLLREMPELSERLIDMGYEADAGWTKEYC